MIKSEKPEAIDAADLTWGGGAKKIIPGDYPIFNAITGERAGTITIPPVDGEETVNLLI